MPCASSEGSRDDHDGHAADILKVDLLAQIGRYGHARVLANTLLRGKALSLAHRSACEFVLARVDKEDGDLESSVARLQKASNFALQAQDLERACWSQLRLLLELSESSPEAVSALLSEIRSNTRKLGSPQLTAALHIFVGEVDAKRGLFRMADRHTQLGLQLLSTAPNLWLQAVAEITCVALAIMRSDYASGFTHVSRALTLAEQSGRAAARRAALAKHG